MTVASANELERRFHADLSTAHSLAALSRLESDYLGKKGQLRVAMREVGALPADQRAAAGQPLVSLERRMRAVLGDRQQGLIEAEREARMRSERLDMSLPGRGCPAGHAHPVTIVEQQCLELLRRFGFELVDGPEVDNAVNNFDALNIPAHHPARQLQDTFWLVNGALLRSHTTTVQARVLASGAPLPVKVASAGRVYRNEASDSTHLSMFHQLEGFWAEPGLTLADLKGVLRQIVAMLYPGQRIRFKPKYYPYTEPSLGLDLVCTHCDGSGCPACHGSGWVTLIGCGMIHPAIFERFGYPSDVTGMAFGWGTSRMASQWAGLPKVKQLYGFNQRVLRQIHGNPR